MRISRRISGGLCVAAIFSALHTNAAITITDGPSAPDYPAAMPDPWIVPGTLTPNGTLTVDGTSSVQAGTLALGGRTLVNGDGDITADSIDFLGSEVDDEIRSDLFISGGTVTTEQIAPRMDAIIFLKVSDDGSFTTNAAGGVGDNSRTLISLESGGSFLATGTQTFGSDSGDFRLSPGAGDSSFEEADDQVSDLINEEVGNAFLDGFTDTPQIGGSNTTFQITGDADFRGDDFDAIVILADGSLFEVTGDLTGGGESNTFGLVALDSTFTIGGDASWNSGSNIAVGGALLRSTADIGGDWLITDGTTSAFAAVSLFNSDLMVGGAILDSFQTSDDVVGAQWTFTDNSTVTVTEDFLIGSPTANNSTVEFNSADTDFDIGGDFVTEIGAVAVMNNVATNTDFVVGGDIIRRMSGNSSAHTFDQMGGSITSGGSVIFDSSNAEFSSTSISITDLPFDIAADFKIAACAAGSDSLTFMSTITGRVGGDYLFEVGGRSGEITTVVLVDHQLSIGGDARFTRPGGAGGSQTFFAGNLDLGIGGDLEFGPDHVATLVDSRLRFDGAGTIAGEVIASDLETAGILTVTSGGILTPELTPAGVDSPALGLEANGDLIFSGGSNLKIALISEGTTTPYVTASSGVNLGSANLVAMLGDDFNPPPGTVFTLIAKDGAAPVTGTYNGLAEGDTILLQTASCFGTFQISYVGGDGNDVTLTVLEDSEAGATITVVDEPTFNPQTDYFEQRVTVTNPCSSGFESFILTVDVPENVTVANRSSIAEGVAFVQGGSIASGESITFVIEFFVVDRDPDFSPSYSLQITSGPPTLPAAVSGPAGAATRMINKPNGDMLVEFNTVPGKLYEFQYGSSPAEFIPVRPQFRAVANRTQFLDNGAPKTNSHPSTVGARFYRIVEVEAPGG